MSAEFDPHSSSSAPRSFVRRAGRLTGAQARALREQWTQYGLEDGQPIDPVKVFGRSAPLGLEIGFGMGDALAETAAANPDWDYIGIEVHEPGVGRLLHLAAGEGLTNLRVIKADAVEVLRRWLPAASLDKVMIFFPDPWPKKRHHKRRLIQPAFVELLEARLKPGGQLHLATDWEDYAMQMLEVLEANASLRNAYGAGQFAPDRAGRPATKFERRGERLGHGIWDLVFESVQGAGAA